MNTLHLAGNLGADPEVRFTPNGNKVTTLRLATRSRRSGNDVTIWWRVTIWGDQFDKLISHLKKGSSLIAIGDMQKPEIYTDKSGASQVSLNMTAYHLAFSPFGRSDRPADENAPDATTHAEPAMSAPAQGAGPDLAASPEDDLPF